MADYKIVASDLDGTLLDSFGNLREENKRAIDMLAERGVQFVPCTGRTLNEMDLGLREIPSIRYIIHSDGAVIYDKKTDRRITMCMSKEDAGYLFDVLAEYPTFFTIRYHGNVYNDAAKQRDEVYDYFQIDNYSRTAVIPWSKMIVDHFDTFCRSCEEVEMVGVFFHTLEERDDCINRLEKTGNYLFARWEGLNYCEVFSIHAGKGNALLRLAEELGYDRSQTIGVGDSNNDATLIECAGLGLAMSNGFASLKQAADAVICSNDEHAIQYILEHYI